MIVTASLTLTSPVPNPADTIKVWVFTTDSNDNDIINRDITLITDLLSRNEGDGNGWEVWGCLHGQTDCHFCKRIDESEARDIAARSDLGIADVTEVAAGAEANWGRTKECYKIRFPGKEPEEYCYIRKAPSGVPGRRDQ